MKTASVALVLCLNIGVDPPDVVKIQPCSRLECWIDPSSVSAPKAMELIGSNLQMQYERWQPRARYKKCHDPTVEDVKKLCTSLRRNAKGERILFHYNGHGVPKPTANGEIWVFNKTFTQYIPLSIFELINWMAAPSIYVYDCSNAGIIINSFQPFAEQHEEELEKAAAAAAAQQQALGSGSAAGSGAGSASAGAAQSASQLVSYKNCIHLAACAANEILPMNSQLPADLFTSCLTTPINIALKWYAMQEKLGMVPRIQSELIDKIPGKVNDRRTMMGELNWIFTAITDTIAWNTLPRELFQRLFRQDLLVASLFRNFLLAERILRSHDCTPVSLPALPPCHRHAMWKAWDLVVDLALQQLPDILERQAPYRQLPFFEHQLTAFQVWLDSESESRTPPEQLPIVLQVLLSQVHRLRALELLARFLDLGPWAVNLALGVGIFPYVLKLLQSSTRELRPVLVFIWAKILAVDPSCQVDLVKEYKYFLSVLQDNSVSKQHRTLSAFVLASIVHNFLLGQTSALQGPLLSICLEQLNDSSWLLRQWLAICLGMLWQNFEKARWSGARDLAHEKLYVLLRDAIPEVRAAAVFALGTFISSVTDRSEEQANNIDRIIAITLLETVGEDMSPLVRLELIAALQWMVLLFESQFVTVYMAEHMNGSGSGHHSGLALVSCGGERSASITHGMPNAPNTTHSLERFAHVTIRRGVSSSSISNMSSSSTGGSSSGGAATAAGAGAASSSTTTTTNSIPFQSIFTKLWQGIYNLGQDPFPLVAATAQKVIAHVRDAALCMITAKEATNATTACHLGSSSSSCGGSGSSAGGAAGGGGAASSRDLEKLNNSSLSVSLPPSPNTRCNYLGAGVGHTDSPPVVVPSQWVQLLRLSGSTAAGDSLRKLRTSSMNDETDGGAGGSSAHHHAASAAAAAAAAGELAASSTAGNHQGGGSCSASAVQPIVQTQFIAWTISYFTRPGSQRYSSAEGGSEEEEGQQRWPVDRNSSELRAREYRYQRNDLIRREAVRQQAVQRLHIKLDGYNWLRKTQFTPSLVKLLPYEPQIAVAYKEKVLVYDFVRNSVLSYASEAAAEGSFSSSITGGGGGGGAGLSSSVGNSSGSGGSGGGSGSGSARKSSRLELSAGSGGSGSGGSSNSSSGVFDRVSSFELINAQDVGLMLVAHEDGVIRVWQSTGGGGSDDGHGWSTRLISAWDAMPSRTAGHYMRSKLDASGVGVSGVAAGVGGASGVGSGGVVCSGSGSGSVVGGGSVAPSATAAVAAAASAGGGVAAVAAVGSGGAGSAAGTGSHHLYYYHHVFQWTRNMAGSGIVTAWQQSSQHLVVGGGLWRYLRIWDVERELKLSDLHLGSDSSVCVLSPYVSNKRSDLIVAGCVDGSVRLFDKRCAPAEARIRALREHSAPILHACLRANETTLVTGCTGGKVCVFDLRSSSAREQWQAGSDITAMATHPIADAIACGNASRINIYSLSGSTQNVLRGNDGFMASRNSHPTCLSFHPYSVQLAVGFLDNTVAVYSPTPVL
ncbi:hypothetical protein KR222_002726 [Zaprionus bogoriensis]|nr:hypothetical protein KR222_002726 [Zaprionus bogoriensis]